MKISSGLLLYRFKQQLEFFLVHPGGPFFINKNEGWWTIPKGEPLSNENLLDAAVREFEEETGKTPHGPYIELSPIIQKGGKKIYCWAFRGDLDISNFKCNTFETEWPPKSGKVKSFPEVDKAQWFTFEDAIIMVNEKQAAFLHELIRLIN